MAAPRRFAWQLAGPSAFRPVAILFTFALGTAAGDLVAEQFSLGASFGDLLSQPRQYGGLGLGPVITSALFLVVIIGVVVYMSVRHQGEEPVSAP